ncbi:MAG: hypothetical protein V4702_04865 [Patescibacteria group bacterium]
MTFNEHIAAITAVGLMLSGGAIVLGNVVRDEIPVVEASKESAPDVMNRQVDTLNNLALIGLKASGLIFSVGFITAAVRGSKSSSEAS